jgi:hypothetical protein
MRILIATLDGQRIAYTDETVFNVQVGRYSKGSYKTRYAIVGNLGQALFYYKSINIGHGYKKRLLVPSFNKPILAQEAS